MLTRICVPVAFWSAALVFVLCPARGTAEDKERDFIKQLQISAIEQDQSPAIYWGTEPGTYSNWTSHSNRLIPVYSFGTKNAGPGVDLQSYQGQNSPYRLANALRAIYGRVPADTLNPEAEYFDQSNLGQLQKAALKGGKKYVFLVVFDGMDWQTTFAAATYKTGQVGYEAGRGTGLHFQDYQAEGTTQFGLAVTSPHNDDTKANANKQQVTLANGAVFGGYNPNAAGPFAWSQPRDLSYLIGKKSASTPSRHAVPDSAATATALTTGVKTYNDSVGVGPAGEQLVAAAHEAQDRGMAVGVVTSVPISHATPACAYGHNVSRNDFQDLTRDLLGLKSISHPSQPLQGVDVLIGAGHGTTVSTDKGQGENFVPGNRYLTEADLKRIDHQNGGRYQVALRTEGKAGAEVLKQAAQKAVESNLRLFGYFGFAKSAHLPFRTADGGYDPVKGKKYPLEQYTPADLRENPKLSDMTAAALTVLSQNPKGFWLMVEPGDVDWANHDNNLDNSIGAVLSGDEAVRIITQWVEENSNWQESLLIVTADHGHLLNFKAPELLTGGAGQESEK